MAVDPFTNTAPQAADPGYHAAAVTPSDGTDLTTAAQRLFVGGAGNVAMITAGGDTVTFTGVAAGTVLPVRVARVKATGTTATNMVAIW